jgi:hypothetical protein
VGDLLIARLGIPFGTGRGLERVVTGVRRQAVRRGSPVAALVVDLVALADGTDPGSAVPFVADLLGASVRTTDRVARTAPDRFAVLLAAEPTYALDTAERLHRGSRRGLRPHGLAVRVGAAWRAVEDCDGPAGCWLPALLDEAAGTPRFG